MDLHPRETRGENAGRLPRAEQRTGVDRRNRARGEEARGIFSLAPPFITQPEPGETAIQNVFRVMHVRVPNDQNLGEGRDYDVNRREAQAVLRGQYG